MPPKHIAQTSTEAKKAYKKNGSVISESTHKQLQRGHELEQRAERERGAEQRRKLAKERREERERKEEAIRQQLGVGLATQMIGYSHTQANLKKGMEAFLGISKKKQDEDRRRKEEEKQKEEELAKKLEVIAQDIEKEPFDDDDDMEDAMLDLPAAEVQVGSSWVDDDLDDDTLLEVHDLVMSDPIDAPANDSMPVPPSPATAPPTQHKRTLNESHHSPIAQAQLPRPPNPDAPKEDIEFIRMHGPTNRIVESALEKFPGAVMELLSHDVAAAASDWMPAHGLLYKLNPAGLPPHRLRIKVGCVVICLRDLNTSSQLSKSQHVRILRVENERLECLTLDGQLEGTKTVITRVSFSAKYRNDDKFPFTRTQYPVRVATDYVSTDIPRETSQSGFKLPSINGQMRPSAVVKRPSPPPSKPNLQITLNPSFKLPGLPASKGRTSNRQEIQMPGQHLVQNAFVPDSWDDFLESGTQIARELSADVEPNNLSPKTLPSNITPQSLSVVESIPPLSTQDLDFSLDDLDDDAQPQRQSHPQPPSVQRMRRATGAEPTTKPPLSIAKAVLPNRILKSPPSVPRGPLSRTANIRRIDPETDSMPPPVIRPPKPDPARSKRPMAPPAKPAPPAKKLCVPTLPLAPAPLLATTTTVSASAAATTATMAPKRFVDFGISTQEASSFFDDDDEFAFGSPRIAV